MQPAARKIGQVAARDVVTSLPAVPLLNDLDRRRLILTEGSRRPAQRLVIQKALVEDKANSLRIFVGAGGLPSCAILPGRRDH